MTILLRFEGIMELSYYESKAPWKKYINDCRNMMYSLSFY